MMCFPAEHYSWRWIILLMVTMQLRSMSELLQLLSDEITKRVVLYDSIYTKIDSVDDKDLVLFKLFQILFKESDSRICTDSSKRLCYYTLCGFVSRSPTTGVVICCSIRIILLHSRHIDPKHQHTFNRQLMNLHRVKESRECHRLKREIRSRTSVA